MYILDINQRHEQSHTFGPIQQTMQILQFQDKGTHLNTIERFFIYAEFLKTPT